MKGNYVRDADTQASVPPIQRLANAIIEQAARDYRSTRRRAQKKNCPADVKREQTELRRFFRSKYFGVLTGLDGDELLQLLSKEEVPRRGKTNVKY